MARRKRITQSTRTLWILLAGDPGVGKSSFLDASKGDVVHNSRWDNYGFKSYSVVRGDYRTEVQIYDPRGFATMTMNFSGIDGVLILFDVTKYETFVNVREWLNTTRRYGHPSIDKLILGNKCDSSSLRVVAGSTAKNYADLLQVPYMEVSATTRVGVEEAIQLLVTKIMDRIFPTSANSGPATISSGSAEQTQQAQFLLYEPRSPESSSVASVPIGPEPQEMRASTSNTNDGSELDPRPLEPDESPIEVDPNGIQPEMASRVVTLSRPLGPPLPSETLLLLLVGDTGVGKSSFFNVAKGDLVRNSPLYKYSIKSYSAVRGDIKTEARIYDSRDTQILNGVDGILVLFDVTRYETFLNARGLLEDQNQYGSPNLSKILVGNKSDLSSSRVLLSKTAENRANRLSVPFMETSATAGINVEEAIQTLVTKIMDRLWPATSSCGLARISSGSTKQIQPPLSSNCNPPPNSSAAGGRVGPASEASEKQSRTSNNSNPTINSMLPETDGLEWSVTKPEMILKVVGEVLNDPQKYTALLEPTGHNAQTALNLLQKTLDYQLIPEDLRSSACAAISQISLRTGLYPDISTLKGVRFEAEPTASGAFGDTWKGFFGPYPVCLKVARVHQSNNAQRLIADYVKETLTFGQLEHQNIIPFYGIFNVKDPIGRIGTVTPWMQDGTIHEYLDLYPEAPRLPLIYDMLEGVSYLHSKSVIHGDLKASNVLITSAGSACVADFGLFSIKAKDIEAETSSQLPNDGNVRWKAPELMDELQNGSLPSPTLQSDVYSAASVMYEVLVGRAPFYELRRDVAVVARVVRGIRPTQPSQRQYLELSDEIWAIMNRLWSSIPTERPSIHQALASLHQIQPVQLTTTRLWKAVHNPRADQRKHLAPQAFRVAMRDENHNFSEDEIQYLRRCYLG